MLPLSLVLPWPPASLSPNTRQHWSRLAHAKKSYREACFYTVKSQGAKRLKAERLHVSLVFVPPTRRAYDLDNALARMKSGLDGLADALGVDDSLWTLTISMAAGEVGGLVRVKVEACPT